MTQERRPQPRTTENGKRDPVTRNTDHGIRTTGHGTQHPDHGTRTTDHGPRYPASMAPSMRLIELNIPLRRPLSNARGPVSERRIILVAISVGGATGWGEAAPYPGVTTEDADDVWRALAARRDSILNGDSPALPVTAVAAVDQARRDLVARQEGEPLWAYAGGAARPVRACAAIGLERSPGDTVKRVGQAINAGIQEVKVKIEPGRDLEYLRAVRGRFKRLAVAADANGSYEADDRFLEAVDTLGLEYLEQPLPADDLTGHAILRERVATPICLDESAMTLTGVIAVLEHGAADIVSLKPGILGVSGLIKVAVQAEAAGVAVKIGGLVETSVGRAHALALATRPSVGFTDLVPPLWLLTADVSQHPWELTDGCFSPSGEAGLGIDVDAFIGEAVGYLARQELFTARRVL